MKSLRWFNVLAVLAMLLSVLPVQAASKALPIEPVTRYEAEGGDDPLQRLLDDTGGTARVSLSRATGQANFVHLQTGSLPTFKMARLDDSAATERAFAFFREYGGAFGIRDAERELQLAGVSTDPYGMRHVEYVQMYEGVPVFASSLRAHFDKNGQLTAINGVFIPKVGVNPAAALSAEQAADIAIAHVEAPTSAASDATPAQKKGDSSVSAGLEARSTTLYVFRANLVRGIPGANHLAYEVEVTNGRDVREFVYVDAHTGAVIEQFTGTYNALYRRAFDTDENYPTTPFWTEGQTLPTGNTEANNVIYASGELYNVIGSLTGGAYLSWDGADAQMDNIFNTTTLDCPNAEWTGTYSHFCTDVTGDDTVAHEWGHAYTDGTHNLIYAWQAGALSETYSDIWGEVVDFLNGRGLDTGHVAFRTTGSCSMYITPPGPDNSYRWLSGEDDPGMGAIRDLWLPSCFGDPDRVSDANYYCGTGDQGGVHTNCGVTNHAFALLTDGGAFNGQTIAGIGITKTAHLYWRTQSVYQTPTTDFQDHANALVQSCQDLRGQPLRELSTTTTNTGFSTAVISQADCDELDKVIAAVEMNVQPTQCGFTPMLETPAPSLCGVLEDTNTILTQDWEAGLGTWITGTRAIANPATFDSLDWFVKASLPDGRAGQAVFAENDVNKGDCGADDESGVRYLESPTITVPAAAALRLAFDHWVATEADWDGGNVKISVNGGAWQLVPAEAYPFNAYPATLSSADDGNTNPMAGEEAFTGTDGGANSGSWGQSQVDLSGLAAAGDQIKLRFELGADGCNGSVGWYVDTVQLYQCVAAPAGVLNGAVSDGANPIYGAEIEAVTNPTFDATTDQTGWYSMTVLAGTYTVTASAFGHLAETATGVIVAEDLETTQDFVLTALPSAVLNGTVTDAATGWPLYASIDISSTAGQTTLWTDPENGAYSLVLPTGMTHTLTVNAWVDGYVPETVDVNISAATTHDFALDADLDACTAPGYVGGSNDVMQDGSFEAGSPNPYWGEGGTTGYSPICDASCSTSGNPIANTGDWAVWFGGWSSNNTHWVTQSVTIPDSPATLSFWLHMEGNANGLLDVSIDGTTIVDFTQADAPDYTDYTEVTVDVSAYADGNPHVLDFTGQETGTTGISFFVDDVVLAYATPCVAPTGGLIVGNVYDANTDDGINGAAVSGTGGSTTTAATLDDPGVADGFYTLFSPAGSQVFTATKPPYTPAYTTTTITAGDAKQVNFTLSAPLLDYEPEPVSVELSGNQQTVETLTFTNTGTADLNWSIVEAGIPGGAYSNGPLVTHPGGGAGGADASALQTGLGMGSNGFGHSLAADMRVADDFTLVGGAYIDTIVFYAYQTGSPITSTIDHVNLQIWQGRPGDPGSTVIWGDTSTNRLVSTTWSNIYRVSDTTLDGTTRPLMANTVDVGLLLPPGTYWLDWQTGGTLASGPWVPPITILGQTTTGNARQWDGIWSDLVDVGPQGLPFVLNGPAGIPWLSESPAAGTLATGHDQTINLTFDSTGMAAGIHTSLFAITSNDPLNPHPYLPVTLTVEVAWGVALTPATAAQSGDPGTTVTYTLRVTNTGTVIDTFILSAGGTAWTLGLPTSVGPLAVGEGADIQVIVRIPAGASAGESNVLTVTATSQGDESETASSILTTTANAVRGVSLTPLTTEQSGDPGTTVTYTLHITNTGNGVDTFTLSQVGAAWTTDVPASAGPLAIGEATTIQVVVHIPSSPGAASDAVTITATSQGDETKTASSTLTTLTTAMRHIYLPLVCRQY